MSHTAPHITYHTIQVPTERRIIKALRDALLDPQSVAGVRVKARNSAPIEEADEALQVSAAEKAFSQVLSKRCSINVVCLLHEDFPVELPVFGGERGGARAVAGQAEVHAGAGAGHGEVDREVHVLMVLGL